MNPESKYCLLPIQVPNVGTSLKVQIKALCCDGKSLVANALGEWQRSEVQNYRKIMTALAVISLSRPVTSQNHVKKCQNPRHDQIYEARAHKLSARIMFFYVSDANGDEMAILTNSYWKGKGNQDAAFSQSHMWRDKYLEFIKTQNRKK